MNSRSGGEENISVVLGRFQGLAVGMAFLFGIPLGAALGAKGTLMTPLRVSIGLCLLNALLIGFYLPESMPAPEKTPQPSITTSTLPESMPAPEKTAQHSITTSIQIPQKQQKQPKKILWNNANPFGALKMLRRDQHLITGAAAYLFVNIAQAGVQINWINYLQYRFGWSAAKSGSTMLVVGVTVAILPKILIRVFGSTVNAISFALALHGLAIVALGVSNVQWQIYTAMTLFAAGNYYIPINTPYQHNLTPYHILSHKLSIHFVNTPLCQHTLSHTYHTYHITHSISHLKLFYSSQQVVVRYL